MVGEEKTNWNEKLFWACKHGDIALAEEAIKNGADVNAKDKEGNTALIDAAGSINKNNKEIVELLINSGADVNAKNNAGWTALMSAAFEGNKEIVETLIKAGADVNAKDSYGDTALILAATNYGSKDVIEILIKAGADVNAKNKNGESAFTFASEHEDREVLGLLENAKKVTKEFTPYKREEKIKNC